MKRHLKKRFNLVIGFIFGFTILHVSSMAFDGIADPRLVFDASLITRAFEPYHLPMAFFFGILGVIMAWGFSYYENVINRAEERLKLMEGLLPICAYCKKIRDDEGHEKGTGDWMEIEGYISKKTSTDFTHGICPDCFKKVMEEDKADETEPFHSPDSLCRPSP